jgi:cyanate permease
VFGIIALSGQAGSGLGPFVVGFLEDRSGGYDLPFTVAALVTYAAAVVVLLARPVAPPASVAGDASEVSREAAG